MPSRRDPKQLGSDGPGEPCPPGCCPPRSSPRWPRSGCLGLASSASSVGTLGTSATTPGFGSAGAVELWPAEWEHALRRPAAVRAGSQASRVCLGPACSARFGEKPCSTEGGCWLPSGALSRGPEAGLLEFLGPRATSLCCDQHHPCSACESRDVPQPPDGLGPTNPGLTRQGRNQDRGRWALAAPVSEAPALLTAQTCMDFETSEPYLATEKAPCGEGCFLDVGFRSEFGGHLQGEGCRGLWGGLGVSHAHRCRPRTRGMCC